MVQAVISRCQFNPWCGLHRPHILVLCADLQPVHILQTGDARADSPLVGPVRDICPRVHPTILLPVRKRHRDLHTYDSESVCQMDNNPGPAFNMGHKFDHINPDTALQEL